MITTMLLTLLSELFSKIELGASGALFMILYILIQWPKLPISGKVLTIGAGILILIAVSTSHPLNLIIPALERAAFMGAFLTSLSLLRAAAEDSAGVRRCGHYLLSQKSSSRYFSFFIGGTLFGAIINVGVLNLFGAMLKSAQATDDNPQNKILHYIQTKRSLTPLLRGFACSLLWSPLAISLAITLKALPNLSWATVLLGGFIITIIFYLVGWIFDNLSHRKFQMIDVPMTRKHDWKSFLFPVLLNLSIFIIALCTKRFTNISLVGGVMTGASIIAILWLLIQGIKRKNRENLLSHPLNRLSIFLKIMVPTYRMQIVIMSTAGFFGAIVSYFLDPRMIIESLAWLNAPPFIIPAVILTTIIGCGLLGLNPVMTVVIIASALPNPSDFQIPSVTLGLTYLIAWGLTIGSSPVAMSTLIIGSIADKKGSEVGLKWNGIYTFGCALIASIVLGLSILILPL